MSSHLGLLSHFRCAILLASGRRPGNLPYMRNNPKGARQQKNYASPNWGKYTTFSDVAYVSGTVGLIPSATLDCAALMPRWHWSLICQISIHSRGQHLCRCIHACDCPTLHQYAAGRIHAAVTWILPSQPAQNCSVEYPDHMIRAATIPFHLPPYRPL